MDKVPSSMDSTYIRNMCIALYMTGVDVLQTHGIYCPSQGGGPSSTTLPRGPSFTGEYFQDFPDLGPGSTARFVIWGVK